MQPLETLEQIKKHVHHKFSGFGLNKKETVVRMLFEISRRDNISYLDIIPEELCGAKDFFQLKRFLNALRYPLLMDKELKDALPFAPLKLSPENIVDPAQGVSSFKKVFFEHSVSTSLLLERLRTRLPDASFNEISSYKEYVAESSFLISTYNRRAETLFIIKENFDFFLHCPCTPHAKPCVYHIMNAGMGCFFDCEYCYLQGYTNSPGLVIPANLDDILNQFHQYHRSGMRLGTGQFTDSLALDELTGFSPTIIDFFRQFPDVLFEFKTKSNVVSNILKTPPAPNILISWSVNPQSIINRHERLTASLTERLEAARQCVKSGYHVGFHFDPIIYSKGWEDDYQNVVKMIFDYVPADKIKWISLGCLRMSFSGRQVMEQRFPTSRLLDAEQIIGFDQKVRYPIRLREMIYKKMIKMISDCGGRDVFTYLCMEDAALNTKLKIPCWKDFSRH